MPSKLGVESILARLKRDILLVSNDVVYFVLYGSAVRDVHPRDIDVALIVRDGTDIFDFTRAVAPVVAFHTAESGIFISCFPVELRKYNMTLSQFLSNVRAHGRKF